MSKRGGKDQWDDDGVLQAVVLSDAFTNRFMPLTAHTPRALLPLANTPLIDYTLEFLAAAGVQEVYVLCGAFADRIQAYISSSKWAQDPSFKVTTYVLQRCLNIGDALREIDALGIHLRGTFILVTGDIVSNCRLNGIQAHNERVQADKTNSTIMTMLFQQAEPGHRLRCSEERIAVALEHDTGLLLAYERSEGKKNVKLPLGVFQGRSSVDVRTNLVTSHVYICSPEVKVLFADNFDYESMSDLVQDVVEKDENTICEYKVYGEVLCNEYAARVGSLRSYDSVSKDVIQRWTYPLVPDLFSTSGSLPKAKGHNVYLGNNVILSRTSMVRDSVLIGEGSRVGKEGGAETVITKSVIGRNCVIGAGVRISNAYLWDGVVVEDNCTITAAILADGVVVKHDVTINDGCLLSKDVVIGPNLVVPKDSKFNLLSSKPDTDGFGSDDDLGSGDLQANSDDASSPTSGVTYNPEHVGAEGRGFLWVADPDDPDYQLNEWERDEEAEEEEESDDASVSSFDEEEEEVFEMGLPHDPFTPFYEEVLDVIRERVQKVAPKYKDVQVENVALEISASRAAHDMTPRDTARAIATSIVGSSDAFDSARATVTYLKESYSILSRVLGNYVKSREDQIALINAIEEACTISEFAGAAFQTILHVLYNADESVLEEEHILSWYNGHNSQDEIKKKLHAQVKPFIEWLQNAEEESEESSDEED